MYSKYLDVSAAAAWDVLFSVPQVALQALGLDADREEIQKMVPDSGEIDFSDFLKVTTLKMVSATQLLVRSSL